MQKMINQSRVVMIILAFLFMLAPMAVLADTSKKEEISYVALGDSLAAGLLSNGKMGTGYVGHIVKDLESKGYDVTLYNEGVPGFTTEQVLQGLPQLEKLASADMITLSAGANDILREIDISKTAKFDPKYLIQEEVEKMKNNAKVPAMDAMKAAEILIIDQMKAITNMEVAVNDVLEKAKSYEDRLPHEIKGKLDDIVIEVENVKYHMDGAEIKVSEAGRSLESGEGDYMNILNELSTSLGSASANINDILNHIKIIEELEQNGSIPEEIKDGIQQLKNETTTGLTGSNNTKNKIDNAISTIHTYHQNLAEIDSLVENAQEVQKMMMSVQMKMETVGENTGKIIGLIKQINPSANIYVMGYYNALPYLPPNVQEFTIPLVHGLNKAIQQPTETMGATYIPTFKLFEGAYEKYLPNPADIHPNEEGYRIIASGFLNKIGETFPGIPKEKRINLGEKVRITKGQLITINGTNVQLLLPNDLPTGTTLIVTATDTDKIAKASSLKAVGDVLQFIFDYPNQDYEGKYKLMMGYDADSVEEIDIYSFNEEINEWEKQNGEVDKQLKIVSSIFSDSVNIGVFAKKDEIKQPGKDVKEPKDEKKQKKKIIIEDSNDLTKKHQTPEKVENVKYLPNTATTYYNWMMIGIVILMVGTISWIMINRHRVLESKKSSSYTKVNY